MSGRRRYLSVVLSLITLLGLGYVVGVASRFRPDGVGDEPIFDFDSGFNINLGAFFAWVIFVLAIVGAVLIVFALREVKPRREQRKRNILGIVIGVIVFFVIFRLFQPLAGDLLGAGESGVGEEAVGEGGQLAGGPVAWLFSLLVAAVVAAALTRVGMSVGEVVFEDPTRPERPSSAVPTAASPPAPVPLDDDPRSRILNAYHRFEQAAYAAGFGRGRNETANRHARRVEESARLGGGAVSGLMNRFAMTRFGDAAVDEDDAEIAEYESQRLVEDLDR